MRLFESVHSASLGFFFPCTTESGEWKRSRPEVRQRARQSVLLCARTFNLHTAFQLGVDKDTGVTICLIRWFGVKDYITYSIYF